MLDEWLALPKLIKFMIVNFADGVALGWTCGLLVIWLDVCRIGSLLARFDSALLTTLFFAQSGLLFGTLALSVAVMTLGEDGS